jgi:hypothetical protein
MLNLLRLKKLTYSLLRMLNLLRLKKLTYSLLRMLNMKAYFEDSWKIGISQNDFSPLWSWCKDSRPPGDTWTRICDSCRPKFCYTVARMANLNKNNENKIKICDSCRTLLLAG